MSRNDEQLPAPESENLTGRRGTKRQRSNSSSNRNEHQPKRQRTTPTPAPSSSQIIDLTQDDDEVTLVPNATTTTNSAQDNSPSEASLSTAEIECSICYESVAEQGVISCCRHEFCFECIFTWSKKSNACPICKQRFTSISRKDLKPSAQTEATSRPSRIRVRQRDFTPDDTARPLIPAEMHRLATSLENWLQAILNSTRRMEEEDDEDSEEELGIAGLFDEEDDEDDWEDIDEDDDDDDEEFAGSPLPGYTSIFSFIAPIPHHTHTMALPPLRSLPLAPIEPVVPIRPANTYNRHFARIDEMFQQLPRMTANIRIPTHVHTQNTHVPNTAAAQPRLFNSELRVPHNLHAQHPHFNRPRNTQTTPHFGGHSRPHRSGVPNNGNIQQPIPHRPPIQQQQQQQQQQNYHHRTSSQFRGRNNQRRDYSNS